MDPEGIDPSWHRTKQQEFVQRLTVVILVLLSTFGGPALFGSLLSISKVSADGG